MDKVRCGYEMGELVAYFRLLFVHGEFITVYNHQIGYHRGMKQPVAGHQIVPISGTDAHGYAAEPKVIVVIIFQRPGPEKIGRRGNDETAGAFTLNPALAKGGRIRKTISVKDVAQIGCKGRMSQAFRRDIRLDTVKGLGAMEVLVYLKPQLESELPPIGIEADFKVILGLVKEVEAQGKGDAAPCQGNTLLREKRRAKVGVEVIVLIGAFSQDGVPGEIQKCLNGSMLFGYPDKSGIKALIETIVPFFGIGRYTPGKENENKY